MKTKQKSILIYCCIFSSLGADIINLITVEPFKKGGKIEAATLSSLGDFIENRGGVQRKEYKKKDEILVKKYFVIVSRLVAGKIQRSVFRFGEDDEKAWRFHLEDGDVVEIGETKFLRLEHFSVEENLKHPPLFFTKPQDQAKSEKGKRD